MASSQYLSTKTSALISTTPVSPSQAHAAQIPLQSFNLPTFPSEAFTAGLDTLILTSDIKLDEYTALLTQPFSIPELPSSIKSLALELFSLGYPPGFLASLGAALPHLRALTIYSQLLGGTTPTSRTDALSFLSSQRSLSELHLLDVFGPSNFFGDLAHALSPTLKFLEVNYTYRHSDPLFLSTVPARDLAACVKEGLAALTLSISAPDVTDDAGDREGEEVGIKPVAGEAAREVVAKLRGDGGGLVMLDVTMFALSVREVEGLLDGLGKLKVLSFTVDLESGWEELLEVLGSKERGSEVVEIVGCPGEGMVEELKKGGQALLKREELEKLGGKCKSLKMLKVSILRTRLEQWARGGEGWVKKE